MTSTMIGRAAVAPPGSTDRTWVRCPGGVALVYSRRLEHNLKVCPECGYHFRLSATERLEQVLDPGSLTRYDADAVAVDVLGFVDTKPYPARLAEARARTGNGDSVVYGIGRIDRLPVVVAGVDLPVLGGRHRAGGRGPVAPAGPPAPGPGTPPPAPR